MHVYQKHLNNFCGQVAMLRCGQPLTTMGSKRSREDEKLVNATLGKQLKGVIIDTRSQTAAMNSRTKGKWKSNTSLTPLRYFNLRWW